MKRDEFPIFTMIGSVLVTAFFIFFAVTAYKASVGMYTYNAHITDLTKNVYSASSDIFYVKLSDGNTSSILVQDCPFLKIGDSVNITVNGVGVISMDCPEGRR